MPGEEEIQHAAPTVTTPSDTAGDAPLWKSRHTGAMAQLRLFASAREAAGTGKAEFPGATVGEVLDAACDAFGGDFAGILATCNVWVNGDQAEREHAVGDNDEVAVLPPVSGG